MDNSKRVNFIPRTDGETSVYDVKTGRYLGEFVREDTWFLVYRRDANGEESGHVKTVEEAIDILCGF